MYKKKQTGVFTVWDSVIICSMKVLQNGEWLRTVFRLVMYKFYWLYVKQLYIYISCLIMEISL